MTDTLMLARADAVQELTKAMFTAAGNALIRHGNDPQSELILGAAIAMFVDKTDELQPGFKRHLIALLSKNSP